MKTAILLLLTVAVATPLRPHQCPHSKNISDVVEQEADNEGRGSNDTISGGNAGGLQFLKLGGSGRKDDQVKLRALQSLITGWETGKRNVGNRTLDGEVLGIVGGTIWGLVGGRIYSNDEYNKTSGTSLKR